MQGASGGPNDGLPPPTAAATVESVVTPRLPPADGNPFAGAALARDPAYALKVESSAKASPADAELLRRAVRMPTARWIDSIDAVAAVAPALDAAAAQERRDGHAVVTTFVLYDLPDRDCASHASGGELAVASGGERRYQTEFIDRIAMAFRAHADQRVAVVLEPDSLANLATNMSIAKCTSADPGYRRSTAYAIGALSRPNVSLYLDAAHAGWLGWTKNRTRFVEIVSDVLASAGGADKIRGFATNVSNYDTLEEGDLARLEPSDPAKGELDYVRLLNESLTAAGIMAKGFVVDTGRNGRKGIRARSGSWCNVRGAGLGARPQAAPTPFVDAYLWIKPPGESDGGSDSGQPGFDPSCGGASAPDSAPNAPRAGAWFHAHFVDLVRNATPPLG